MEKLIIVMLLIVLATFVALYFSIRKNVNGIIKSLRHINSNKTNSKILISSTDNLVRSLTMEINKTLEAKKQHRGRI